MLLDQLNLRVKTVEIHTDNSILLEYVKKSTTHYYQPTFFLISRIFID
jgi:hypothetical protein